jgi:hypothetical protein
MSCSWDDVSDWLADHQSKWELEIGWNCIFLAKPQMNFQMQQKARLWAHLIMKDQYCLKFWSTLTTYSLVFTLLGKLRSAQCTWSNICTFTTVSVRQLTQILFLPAIPNWTLVISRQTPSLESWWPTQSIYENLRSGWCSSHPICAWKYAKLSLTLTSW